MSYLMKLANGTENNAYDLFTPYNWHHVCISFDAIKKKFRVSKVRQK
jgi:hypothetical protein